MNTYDIRNKEVINIYDGRSLGFVEDVELNLLIGFRALIVFMRCVRITGKYAIYG